MALHCPSDWFGHAARRSSGDRSAARFRRLSSIATLRWFAALALPQRSRRHFIQAVEALALIGDRDRGHLFEAGFALYVEDVAPLVPACVVAAVRIVSAHLFVVEFEPMLGLEVQYDRGRLAKGR